LGMIENVDVTPTVMQLLGKPMGISVGKALTDILDTSAGATR
jgi:hypothetical protein